MTNSWCHHDHDHWWHVRILSGITHLNATNVDFQYVWHVVTILSNVCSWSLLVSWECVTAGVSPHCQVRASSILVTVLSLDTVPCLLGQRPLPALLTRSHPGSGKQCRDKGWRASGHNLSFSSQLCLLPSVSWPRPQNISNVLRTHNFHFNVDNYFESLQSGKQKSLALPVTAEYQDLEIPLQLSLQFLRWKLNREMDWDFLQFSKINKDRCMGGVTGSVGNYMRELMIRSLSVRGMGDRKCWMPEYLISILTQSWWWQRLLELCSGLPVQNFKPQATSDIVKTLPS